ncbi:uncharacterized protein LOC129411320 [Boleophthalmus pectinirostris]|uniref:uncharacterized protein LOC129411320 n=1 Tax=Boleophthalmus pectinirostris TaxID=150288 RepID=UPI00242F8236|nr:uncharacterized protein LOC129411320 [Boleophthalmus pectinirostris]
MFVLFLISCNQKVMDPGRSAQESRPSQEPTIWIMGDSYVRRGRDRAAETLGMNLGLPAQIQWFGQGGLRWDRLVPTFKQELRRRSAPAVLLICCGSNDLGKIKSVELVATMKRDLLDLHRQFPCMKIFISELSERRLWRDAKPGRINRAKNFINHVMRDFIVGLGGCMIRHPTIKFDCPGLFNQHAEDGTEPLSDVFTAVGCCCYPNSELLG